MEIGLQRSDPGGALAQFFGRVAQRYAETPQKDLNHLAQNMTQKDISIVKCVPNGIFLGYLERAFYSVMFYSEE